MDELRQTVSLGETGRGALAMFVHATNKIIGDANVKRPARLVR
jgi:hypothetical protein